MADIDDLVKFGKTETSEASSLPQLPEKFQREFVLQSALVLPDRIRVVGERSATEAVEGDGVVASPRRISMPVVGVRKSESRPHLLVVRHAVHQDLERAVLAMMVSSMWLTVRCDDGVDSRYVLGAVHPGTGRVRDGSE